MKFLIEKILEWESKQRLLFYTVLFSIFALFLKITLSGEVQAFPDFTNVQVQVITQYPGKSAEEIERIVTRPLESNLSGLPGLVGVRSLSIFGLSTITLTFDDHTDSKNARVEARQRLRDVNLPDEAVPTLGPDSTPIGEIYRYTIAGDMPTADKRLVQDWVLERELKSIPGVADVVTFGGPIKTIDVRLNESKLRTLGLTYEDVADAIRRNHSNAGGGYLTLGEEDYLVRSVGLMNSTEDLADSVVSNDKGRPIRLKDLGQIEISSRPRLGQVGRDDDDDVVEGIVLLRTGYNTLETCNKIKEKLASIAEKYEPQHFSFNQAYDRTRLIAKATGTVTHNVLFGVFLVVAMLFFGLGRYYWSLIAAVALVIPFALLFALVGIRMLGLNPNLISVGAVDFGIIIESAIFGAEGLIHLHHLKGRRLERGEISKALADVLKTALLCGILLAIAFVPIVALERVEGKIFRPLGLTLLCAVAGGFIGALVFLPIATRWFPERIPHETMFDDLSLKIIEKLKSIHAWFTDGKKSYAVVAAFSVVGLIALFSLEREFLPNMNEGSLYVRVQAPKTIALQRSVDLASDIRDTIRTLPEVETVISQVGRPDDGTDTNGFDNMEILVALKDPDQWKSAHTIDGLAKILDEKLSAFPGVMFSFSQPIKDNVDEAISGVKGELVLKVFGNDITQMQAQANQIKSILEAMPITDQVLIDELTGQPELRYNFDRNFISRIGASVASAQKVIEAGVRGYDAAAIMDQEARLVPVVLKPEMDHEPTADDLLLLSVPNSQNSSTSLKSLGSYALKDGVGKIYREDGRRRIALRISPKGVSMVDYVGKADAEIRAKFGKTLPVEGTSGHDLTTLPDMKWAGAFENARRAALQFAQTVPLCLFFIVVLLFAWIQTWDLVCATLLQVPFCVVGALVGLRLFGLSLSISAACGIIVVIGVSLLTGMMIIKKVKEGLNGSEAVTDSLKGVLLSNLVAIIGLVPAAFSSAIGSETAKPFAVAILIGLISSLICSLTIYPFLIDRLRLFFNRNKKDIFKKRAEILN